MKFKRIALTALATILINGCATTVWYDKNTPINTIKTFYYLSNPKNKAKEHPISECGYTELDPRYKKFYNDGMWTENAEMTNQDLLRILLYPFGETDDYNLKKIVREKRGKKFSTVTLEVYLNDEWKKITRFTLHQENDGWRIINMVYMIKGISFKPNDAHLETIDKNKLKLFKKLF